MPPLPWSGGSDREGSLLGSCFSTSQKDAALLVLFANKNTFLQMKTQKTGHPSVPMRKAEVIQGPPTRCFALSDFVSLCISYLSLWLLHCPLFTGVKERPCHAFLGRHTRAGGEQQKSKGDFCLFLYCVVCV